MSNLTLKEQLAALALDSPTAPTTSPPAKTTTQQAPQKKELPNNNIKQKPAWLEQAQYGVELLKAYFPAAFKEMHAIQPLKIGIKQELVIRLSSKNDITLSDKACMVHSLSYYVSALAYLKNVVEGATRIDLDGQPAGAVTAEEARYSMESRQAKLQKKAKPAKQKQLAIAGK
jgi:ProP effector